MEVNFSRRPLPSLVSDFARKAKEPRPVPEPPLAPLLVPFPFVFVFVRVPVRLPLPSKVSNPIGFVPRVLLFMVLSYALLAWTPPKPCSDFMTRWMLSISVLRCSKPLSGSSKSGRDMMVGSERTDAL